jgi:hypothetical protein
MRRGAIGSRSTSTSTSPTSTRAPSPAGGRSRTRSGATWAVTVRCSRCGSATASRSGSGAPAGSSPSARRGSCGAGIGGVECLAAPRGAGWTSTTSCTGKTAASPRRRTWCACARITTVCTTRDASASPATPTTPTAWRSPARPASRSRPGRDRAHRPGHRPTPGPLPAPQRRAPPEPLAVLQPPTGRLAGAVLAASFTATGTSRVAPRR